MPSGAYVGGAAETLARVSPLLTIMGKQVFHLGPVGAGHAMKCINNLVTGMSWISHTHIKQRIISRASDDGMPRSAIATGLVEYELPPAGMPAKVIAYAVHASGGHSQPGTVVPSKVETP